MYGYIYLITNTINNKKYIGQHKADKFDKSYTGSGKLLKHAKKKYGWNNFIYEILEPINNIPTICNSLAELNKSEEFYIDYFDCVSSDEYYNLMRGGHQGGFTNAVRAIMSEKAKNRQHLPTTAGRRNMTNGIQNRAVKQEDIEYHLNSGWWFGRTVEITAWNKGLTAKNNPTVAKYTESRNKHFENGESIGCFGLSGENNFNYRNDQYILDNIINKGFYDIWLNEGKCKVCSKLHIGTPRIYNRCLELCNISLDEDKKHSKEIKSMARKIIK